MSSSSRALSGFQLTGLIERVTFFSEETGFCVLQVKAGAIAIWSQLSARCRPSRPASG